jgi:hypothetical protein
VRCPCHNHVVYATILTYFDVEKESAAQEVMGGIMPQNFVVQVRERHLVFQILLNSTTIATVLTFFEDESTCDRQ